MLATGFDDDEAYTLVISRTLALSYFDHPPLHQWILHGFVALFGESRWARAPFWLMIVTINWPLFGLTRRLFGLDAALWAIFAFNATPYFMVLPDGSSCRYAAAAVLAVAGWVIAEILFAPPSERRSAAALWRSPVSRWAAPGSPNIRRSSRPSACSDFSSARRAIVTGSGISGPSSAAAWRCSSSRRRSSGTCRTTGFLSPSSRTARSRASPSAARHGPRSRRASAPRSR